MSSSLGKLTIAITASTKGLEAAAKRTTSILGSMGRAAVSLPGMLGLAGAGAATAGLISTADAYTTMASQLTYLTGSAEDAEAAEAALFEMSQNTRTSMTDNATALVRLGQAQEMMGTTTEENIEILGGLNALMIATGTTGVQASSAMLQLTQALGSGKLQGDEFRSLMENSPALLARFAESLGVGIGELKLMASEGEITTEVMTDALTGIAESADENMDSLPETFASGWTKVTNAFNDAWNKINDETGIMSLIFKALDNFATWITENKWVFVGWFVEMKDSIVAAWPGIKAVFVSLYEEIGKIATYLTSNSGSFQAFAKDTVKWANWLWEGMKVPLGFILKGMQGIAALTGGVSAAVGTIVGGGGISAAGEAFKEGFYDPFQTDGGSAPAEAKTNVYINTPVNKGTLEGLTQMGVTAGARL